MKKRAVLCSVLFFLLLMPSFAYAEGTSYSLFLNGEQVWLEDDPQVVKDVPYLNIDEVIDAFGFEVTADLENETISISEQGKTYTFYSVQSSSQIREGGFQPEPFISNDKVYIPLTPLMDELPMKVMWDSLSKSVHVYLTDQEILDRQTIFSSNPIEDKDTLIPEGEVTGTAEVTDIRLDGTEVVVDTTQPVLIEHFTLSNPNRIIIDFNQAVLGEALWDEQKLGEFEPDHPYISKVRYAQNDTEVVRVVLDLKKGASYDIESLSGGTTTEVILSEKKILVVLDAGHGGEDPGAESIDGRHEKDFNLAVAKKVNALLSMESSIDVLMTRSDDVYIELEERGEVANRNNADLFISIHGNNFDQKTSGIETYYWQEESLEFAQLVHQNLLEASTLPDRKVKRNNWRVLTTAQMPGVLLELGFLSNPVDNQLMWSEDYQDRVSEAIVQAIKQYFQL